MSTTVTHPADRTVAVSAIRQGSGVLLTDRLVLTCAHVVKSGSVLVAHPALPDRIRATVAWIDYQLDVALLEAVEPVRRVPPVRLGVVDTRQAIPDCEITGFPRVQRYGPDRRLEADQYTATVLPMAGRVRDLLVCDLDGPPAALPDDEPAALSGLSGGPVFMGDVLLGVARQVPRQREGRRVECVPLGPVLTAAPFRLVFRRNEIALRQERVHGSFPRDLRYEAEYAQALGVAYRRTKIFGLDELSRHDSEWDLDTAYLSLEAQAQTEDRAAPGPPLPQRIDALLTSRPRALLRGEAGAGKTTLLWWLAAHASARTLDDDLAPLNGLVPFVVPLRTLRARGVTFPGPAELSGAAGLVVDTAPEGWAGRVLASGRALLLVDGLDEVPPEDREQAHTWLTHLLARYPDTRCVATVRPLAVEPDWLRSEGFAELRLLPMRNEDIQAFVTSWHRAARLSEEDDAERLDGLERDLARQFAQNPALRDLARTPLLCAVICALHRRRDGLLPETRWSLYRSALEMLLGHRDRRRRIGDPEGVELDVEEHTQLLQRIAVWLVREGQSEFTRDQALRQLRRALAGMERVGAQGPPERILTHLLNRSGLLQERGDDTYQFIHRTFQDYLAAKEFVEDDHLNELLRHADEETWQDVILLAAGHCGRRELTVLVRGLLNTGLRHEAGTAERTAVHVLAALCAQHAAWLDGPVRAAVRESTAALFPPTSDSQVSSLARLGPAALAFLPAPHTMSDSERRAPFVVSLILNIGGAAAVPHAREWALAHPWLGIKFADKWERFPPEEYAAEVLAHCTLLGALLAVNDRKQLRALRRLPSVFALLLGLDLSDAEIGAALEGTGLQALFLGTNARLPGLSSLNTVADSLSVLDVGRCQAIRDFTPLAGLHKVVTLFLDAEGTRPGDLAPLAEVPGLRELRLKNLGAGRLSEIAAHPGVTDLTVTSRRPLALDGLDGWKSLTHLKVSELDAFDDALTALREHSRITVLGLTAFPWAHRPAHSVCVPTVEELSVQAPDHGGDLGMLRPLFPGVTRLTLDASARRVLDLTALHSWPGLRVGVTGLTERRLIGAEELGNRLYAPRG
ncbi:NACHT domain-containing protein [Streptomyces sp. C11-1]|uniref:NACHT domain-containing protein n=1 Tax=Streptomyces durocortorensis TaxID=2811104 RepID=A0ABY9VX04_9ACTN|nr:NACHT domain-containing protein [Streptomyces durocortorensis]WNF27719.1 NACHT domain-containing protein [Streptomyces durocortorensis]